MKPPISLNKRLSLLLFFILVIGGQGIVPAQSTAPAPKTVDQLTTDFTTILTKPEYRRARVGFKVISLKTGKVIYEQDAEKYFMPASNMKNFTVATALEKLGPDFRFRTSVYSVGPIENGVVNGPLRVYGRGDVSLSYSFENDNMLKGIDRVADALISAGVKSIEGDIIGDETYFSGSAIPTGWEWDDLQWYYGAEVSALPVNDNAVRLSVTPGPLGYGCTVRLTPENMVYRVVNTCKTVAAGSARTLRIEKKLDQNILEISGDLPLKNAGYQGSVTVSRPAEMFVSLLRQRLLEKGVSVAGRTYAINKKELIPSGLNVEIATIQSPPLSEIAAKTMKPSQNMYTETLLWTIGEEVGRKLPSPNTASNQNVQESHALGKRVVRDFLKEIGAGEDAIIMQDGSGLARANQITPSATVRLYRYMSNESKYAQAWRDSLTIGGVDGTLRNRFKGTRGEKNVRGKTGTIAQVSALSGYVKTASGEELVFSALVNGIPATSDRVALIDELVVLLANFNGKIDGQ
ncbi:MAG: D-alanyl-D-alanine carboxypeptidase/D-alanyl-D-alanine-endopeptidase [Acidobacteria bacterium]|nr:D-alanyl-D-alanine carboxypeptidase/D-alanyl-D-alanine-endopeptidase [Acidobacteriota bacterium]